MEERDGIVERRAPAPETNGAWVSRWLKDTLRMWPIIVLLGAFALRAEHVRTKVLSIEEDFIAVGPRVTTTRSTSVTIEAALKEFQLELATVYQPREIALLEKQYNDLQLNQIASDLAEIKDMVRSHKEAHERSQPR